MSRSVPEKLRRFYDQFSGNDHVLIVINADPDAIASAMAVSRLEKFSRVVIVDSQPDHNEHMAQLNPAVIIDHHPDSGAKAPFLDIRPHYGATCTILTEYLQSANIKPSAKLATGLYHGIKTDTNDFKGQAQIEDVRAFQYLFRHANIHLARKIEKADLRFDLLKYFKIALQNMRQRKGKVYVHLGNVVNPDVCVLIADFFMRVNTVTWSIVSGICDKKLTIIFRNDGIRKNAGKVASEGFGKLGNAGGHKNMARAEIALSDLKEHVDTRNDKKLLSWIIGRTARRAEPKQLKAKM
jgi:nanoRNase/pAp phosphatase (c-di-AMP/oligoRNAs hydrolase)